MRPTTILGMALLFVAFGCKQAETVNTTSSSETTSTVTETATTTAAVTDTSATTGTVTTATVSAVAPVQTTATTATSSKAAQVAEKHEPAKKVSGPTVTETVSSTGLAGLPKNPPALPKSAPPANETMSTALATALAASTTPSLASTGQGIFKSQCVACHGADASGNTAIGKKNNIPDYRSTAVQGLSDAELANVIANGKGPISAAAHKSKHLTTDQINAVIAFIRSLKS